MEKIGDFAKRCKVTVQTLRWYDKLGLLVPDFIDKYTGYRYYDTKKATEVQRITALKDIGFSLEEIKQFCSAEDEDAKEQIIWQKRQELEKLSKETTQKLRILTKIEENLDTDRKGEQKMRKKADLEFENDEAMIGRWELVGMVEKKEDYKPEKKFLRRGAFEEYYMLPNGEKHGYWKQSWTKNYIKLTFNDGDRVDDYISLRYETQEIDDVLHMFVEHEDRYLAVYKQMDKKHYTINDLGQRGDISMIDEPFINDESVLGKWSAIAWARDEISDFNPSEIDSTLTFYYKSAEFLPDGEFRCVMDRSADIIMGTKLPCNLEDSFKTKWTAGVTFYEGFDGTIANKYEIHVLDGKEYLFIEWRSDMSLWHGVSPGYFVFTRDV